MNCCSFPIIKQVVHSGLCCSCFLSRLRLGSQQARPPGLLVIARVLAPPHDLNSPKSVNVSRTSLTQVHNQIKCSCDVIRVPESSHQIKFVVCDMYKSLNTENESCPTNGGKFENSGRKRNGFSCHLDPRSHMHVACIRIVEIR